MSITEHNPQISMVCERLNTKVSPEQLEAFADVFELLALGFSFPSHELAEALYTGDFQSDMNACLDELCIPAELSFARSQSSDELYGDMRREYSHLYLLPGKLTVIYPYESAYRYRQKSDEGMPTLFANPITVDIERFMKMAQALPDNARNEPVDSVFSELNFLRHLYTRAMISLLSKTEADLELAQEWLNMSADFFKQHIDTWLPHFMQETIELSQIEIYWKLAEISKLVLSARV